MGLDCSIFYWLVLKSYPKSGWIWTSRAWRVCSFPFDVFKSCSPMGKKFLRTRIFKLIFFLPKLKKILKKGVQWAWPTILKKSSMLLIPTYNSGNLLLVFPMVAAMSSCQNPFIVDDWTAAWMGPRILKSNNPGPWIWNRITSTYNTMTILSLK